MISGSARPLSSSLASRRAIPATKSAICTRGSRRESTSRTSVEPVSWVACGEGHCNVGDAFWGQRGLFVVDDGEGLGVGAPVVNSAVQRRKQRLHQRSELGVAEGAMTALLRRWAVLIATGSSPAVTSAAALVWTIASTAA